MGDFEVNALLNAATASANDAQMLCEDIAQQLFPRAVRAPSEEVLAATRLLLQKLVAAIEDGLGIGNDDIVPKSWEILCRSGLLREPALIEFALARRAEERIAERLGVSGMALIGQLSNRLLHNSDPAISSCARAFLIAENAAQLRTPEQLARQLPADLLHLLVWRVVAVFQMDDKHRPANLVAQGHKLLSAHDEAAAVHAAAAKLVYFLSEDERSCLDNPVSAGLSLYVSGLAHDFRLPHDRILRFIDEDDLGPLLLMLRARGHDAQTALSILQYLRGQRSDDHLLPDMLGHFDEMGADAARTEVLGWRLGAVPVWKAG